MTPTYCAAHQAARYQMIIMFMIAATTAVGTTATILLGAFCLLDSNTQLRTDLITKRAKQDTLANSFAKAADAVGSWKLCILMAILFSELPIVFSCLEIWRTKGIYDDRGTASCVLQWPLPTCWGFQGLAAIWRSVQSVSKADEADKHPLLSTSRRGSSE